MMRFYVDAWSPEYGTSSEDALTPTATEVDVTCEVAADRWRPLAPPTGTAPPGCIAFVDGVRRVDARVWVETDGGGLRQGICASYAAGSVRCNGKAELVTAIVGRGVFCAGGGVQPIATRHVTYEPRPAGGEAPEQLWLAVQAQMADLEAKAATAAGAGADADVVVVDGPLRDRRQVPGVAGYVKTHDVRYLDPGHDEVVARLGPGERTPLFCIGGGFPRWSWYLRLPHAAGHPWAGVVRLEAPVTIDVAAARQLADELAVALPRFASKPHEDPRAPQNLHPIASLERALRHRLGDQQLLLRAMRSAAVITSASA